jgi:hypothetical protein
MAEGMNGYSLADIGALMGNGANGEMSWISILLLFVLMGGGRGFGFGGFGGGYGPGFGGPQYATSNEVQRGFDNQNSMANQREILNATNQVYHDLATVVGDKYSELTRDIYGVSGQVAQVLANQNACCCDTKMLIQETSAQNRYDALKNTNEINAVTIGQTQKILNAMAQNKIEALQSKVQALELAQATGNVVRYPNTFSYNAGPSPFCGGYGCGCGV